MDREAISAAIAECFPGLDSATLRPAPAQGADSEVWIANEEWILRRAKRAEVREWFAKEAALLPELAELVPVRLPNFELLCPEHGLVGYRMIRGQPLSSELLERAPRRVGADLGVFMARLHSFDAGRAHALGAPVNPLGVPGSHLARFRQAPPLRPGVSAEENGWRAVFAHARTEVVEGFSPYVDAEVVMAIGAVFDEVLDDDSGLAFRPTVVHTELSSEHTLFDDEGHLVGVIDWSDTCISDPAADLALAMTVPEPAAQALLESYGAEIDVRLRRRARAYQAVGAFLHHTHGLIMRSDTITTSAIERARALLS